MPKVAQYVTKKEFDSTIKLLRKEIKKMFKAHKEDKEDKMKAKKKKKR